MKKDYQIAVNLAPCNMHIFNFYRKIDRQIRFGKKWPIHSHNWELVDIYFKKNKPLQAITKRQVIAKGIQANKIYPITNLYPIKFCCLQRILARKMRWYLKPLKARSALN